MGQKARFEAAIRRHGTVKGWPGDPEVFYEANMALVRFPSEPTRPTVYLRLEDDGCYVISDPALLPRKEQRIVSLLESRSKKS